MDVIEYIMSGVNLIINGIYIVALVTMLSTAGMLANRVTEQQIVSSQMREYAQYNQYDHTHVYAQDVATAIFGFRGNPAVKVMCNGTSKEWSQSYAATEYSSAAINAVINQNVIYDADIEKNANGEIVAILFVQCQNDMHCGGR